jgi:predicted RNA-binding Zn ribbon-like protein
MASAAETANDLLPRNEFSGGRLSLNFCNTLSRGPGRGPRDRLASAAMLGEWASRCGWPLDQTPDPEAFSALLDLRAALIGIFDRLAEGEAPDPRHLSALNAELAEAGANECLVPEAKGGWRLADSARDGSKRLRHAIAKDAAQVLTGDLNRLKRCPAHDCLWLFHDSSKNLSRRWCAMGECGSRSKMRRHRSRERY